MSYQFLQAHLRNSSAIIVTLMAFSMIVLAITFYDLACTSYCMQVVCNGQCLHIVV